MVPITIVFMGFINHLTSLGGPTLYIRTFMSLHITTYIYIIFHRVIFSGDSWRVSAKGPSLLSPAWPKSAVEP